MQIASTVIAIVSCVISVISAIIAARAVRAQRNISAHQAAFSFVVKMSEMLQKEPRLLQMHGVTEAELKAVEASAEELAYLVISFAAGEAHHHMLEGDPVVLGKYRENLLENPKVQRVWTQVIRHRMFSPSKFSEEVDRYIKEKPAAESEVATDAGRPGGLPRQAG
jgi:hypothetical protein